MASLVKQKHLQEGVNSLSSISIMWVLHDEHRRARPGGRLGLSSASSIVHFHETPVRKIGITRDPFAQIVNSQ